MPKRKRKLKPLEHPKSAKTLMDDMLGAATPAVFGQTEAVDVDKISERAYRHGLVTALEVILRELR